MSTQPASLSDALLLVCTRTVLTVTCTASKPQAGASVSDTPKVPFDVPALPPPPLQAASASAVAKASVAAARAPHFDAIWLALTGIGLLPWTARTCELPS